MTKEECVKVGKCDCQDCAFNSSEDLCENKRIKLELECPFCGEFIFCNNAEGCDNCKKYENWLKAEEKAVLL